MSLRVLLVAVAAALVVAAGASARPAAAPVTLRISFPEGFTVRQMADRTAAVRRIAMRTRHVTPRLTGASYAAAAAKARAPKSFGNRSVEGFLFPSLYLFEPTTTAARLVANQLDAFERRWRTLDLGAIERRGMTPYDVLIVASMVERETVAPEERPLVAAVIYNRLEHDMVLGIDATLRYGLGIPGTRPLTKTQLESDSPYNTRRFKGLPPTPIGNPGLASMRAAASPVNVDYLYYVRKPDGVHHFFTADDDEFCAKAREYGYSC